MGGGTETALCAPFWFDEAVKETDGVTVWSRPTVLSSIHAISVSEENTLAAAQTNHHHYSLLRSTGVRSRELVRQSSL